MGIPLLSDIVIIFGLSIGVLFICSRLRIPSTVGFLLTGVLAGLYGLGLIKAVHEVEVLAEIGVILLLFTIGMEFSLRALARIKKFVLFGLPLRTAILVGLTLARVGEFSLILAWSGVKCGGHLSELHSTLCSVRKGRL